jgi:hypothetical protein
MDQKVMPSPRASVEKEARSYPWWQWPLRGWLFISAPPEVPPDAPLAKREAVRRGRVASIVLFFVILLVILPLPSAIGNPFLLTTLLLVIVLDSIALLVNRSGRTTTAGIMVVIGIEIGLMTSILTIPGGIAPSNLPLFDLLVQALCVSVSLLAPQTVFLVAVINSIFIVLTLFNGPVTPELYHLVRTDTNRILVQPITLQVIVAIVTFVWANSANSAIKRADRAEEIEALQQRELEQQQRDLDQKQQIEYGIEQILKTHIKIANGDFTARAPLAQDNILWQIARSLNNLLARLQGYNQMAIDLRNAQQEIANYHVINGNADNAQRELQRTREAAARLMEALKAARNSQTPVAIPPASGTVIDEVVATLRGGGPPVDRRDERPTNSIPWRSDRQGRYNDISETRK